MQHLSIPFSTTKRFSQLVTDYASGAEKLQSYMQWPANMQQFADIIAEKSKEQINRAALVQILKRQYQGIDITASTQQNIDAFADVNTFCVVTAHQVNVFTGPLYYLIKTASTIQLCKRLKEEYPSHHFVPVFWQGSEDHDFAEINHAHLFNKTFTWETPQQGATGRFLLADMAPLVNEVIAMLGDGPSAAEMKAMLEDAYLHSTTLADSGRKMLNALFGRYGLVVINGDDREAKALFADVIKDELLHQSSADIVRKTLATFPYDAQANPRDINLFYLTENGRERIISDAATQTFQLHDTGTTFSKEALLEQVDTTPERFSPNVILRPVYQQKILPSIAFIGGGGEVAYWLQLKNLFAYHHVQYPMILIRDSFMLVDAGTQRKLQKLELQVTDLFDEQNALIAQYVRQHSGDTLQFDDERAAIESMIAGLITKARQIDSSLDTAVMAERQAMLNSLQKLESKLLKAEKAKMEVQLNQLKGILAKLFPSGGLQERYDNMIPWYLKFGPALVDEMVLHAGQPNGSFHILFED